MQKKLESVDEIHLPIWPEALLERIDVRSNPIGRGHLGEVIDDSPVDNVTEHCLDELSQHSHDLPPEPLVSFLQVKHLIHKQENDAEGNVVAGLGFKPGANFAVGHG